MKNSLLFIVCISLLQPLYAAKITNDIRGVGPKSGLVNPYFCIQNAKGEFTPVAPGQTVDGNAASGNKTFVGGALRFGGCDPDNNPYLGYISLSVNDEHYNKFDTYSAPSGIHVTLTSPDIDAAGIITGQISYTPIDANFNLLSSEPSKNNDWDFVGVNLSGLEFGKMPDPVVVPNLSAADALGTRSDLADTQAFLKAGMNTVRVQLHWGYLQPDGAGIGDLNQDYFNSYVKPLLESLTAAHVFAIVDLHAYMRYSTFGKQYAGCGADGACPDGTLITDAKAYQDVWTKLYTSMKNDSKMDMNYIMLDLVNEPVAVPDDLVFTIQTSTINRLRQVGFQGYILVEGNSWSGLHSWTTDSWASKDGKTSYTNAILFTRTNFVKAGVTDLSKILINAHQYLDSDYSGTHSSCLTDLTTTGASGFNLNAFADYLLRNKMQAIVTEFGAGADSASCSVAMTKFLNYLQDNAAKDKDYGFVGWTIWSTGHGWGNYNLRVTPSSYHMTVLKKYLLGP
jgi:endoglucanase